MPRRRSIASASHSVNQRALAPPLAPAMIQSGLYCDERRNRSATATSRAPRRIIPHRFGDGEPALYHDSRIKLWIKYPRASEAVRQVVEQQTPVSDATMCTL